MAAENPESGAGGVGPIPAPSLAGSLVRRLLEKYGSALEAELSISLASPGLPSSAAHAAADAGAAAREPLLPAALARYALGGEIARGGMGAIVEAWDRDLARPLAMKVLLGRAGEASTAGDALVQRFVREARITGQLDHPGIVPVHDLGIDDDGRVYFTMRLVRGEDLASVFAAARAGERGWSRARALEVLLKICDTVAYAHSRGVVHRDLKPANVMVGDFGEVTVLDWGLAKVLGEADPGIAAADPAAGEGDLDSDGLSTIAGTVLGTPSYMAPEVAEGLGHRADRRVDVYAIGAMLYTLLAGRPPYIPEGRRTSSRELIAAVRAGPPPSVRDEGEEVPETLAAICERAMARDPEERYASAAEVAAALRAHEEEERRAAEESHRLAGQLADSRGVAGFLKGLFTVDTPADAEKPVSLIEILERGSARIDEDLARQPAMRASVHATIADVLNTIGSHRKAVPHFESAVAAAREHAATAGLDETLPHRLTGLAQVRYETGDYAGAEKAYLEAIALWRELGKGGEPLARALAGLGALRWATGRLEEAREPHAEALAIRRSLPDEEQIAKSLVDIGVLLDSLGDFAGGEALYLEALEIRRRVLGPRDAQVATVLINLGSLGCYRGDFAEAVRQYEEALAIRREALGPKHPKVALALMNLGYALGRSNVLDRAEAVLRECLAIRREILVPDHPNVAHAEDMIAAVLVRKGELAEAEALLDRARDVVDRRTGPEHPLRAWVAGTYAELRERQGRIDEAREELRRAIEVDQIAGGPLTAHTVDHVYQLAKLELAQGRRAEAAELLERCHDVYRRAFRPHDPIVRESAELLARARG